MSVLLLTYTIIQQSLGNPTCGTHSHCPSNLPFCYVDGLCYSCSECHYCQDGIDGTCGKCGVGYPTQESSICLPVNIVGCYGVDNGGWNLVRHSYNKWHPASDNLKGTETYGTFENDPQSSDDFSIEFRPDPTTEFMFSDGECNQYLITTFSQFSVPRPSNPYKAMIKQSHIKSAPYPVAWYFRSGNLEDPWISFDYHSSGSCLTCLYGENSWSSSNLARFASDPYLNVFIRPTHHEFTFGFQVCEIQYGESSQPFTITLWWNTRMFECTVVPRRQRALYTCNSDASTTKKCIPSTTGPVYAMQISNPGDNDACIDALYFKEGSNPFTIVNVAAVEFVGNDGHHFRYYDLNNPSNFPVNTAGTPRTAIPACQTQFPTDGVYCPESQGHSMNWNQKDVGFNIFSSSEVRSDDCVLRFSQLHSSYSSIGTEWINPNKNLVIFSHGWQPSALADNDHYIPDQWKDIVTAGCLQGANSGGVESCPPTDHDAQYWIEEDWNVMMVDWRQWANTFYTDVVGAEERLYTAVWNGKSVITMLYELLIQLLRLTGWNGNELRLVGHSLGSQVVLNLASRIEKDTSHTFHVSRIALLDHYFSPRGKDYLGKHDPHCTDWCVPGALVPAGVRETLGNCLYCNRIWTGEYARHVLLKNIKTSSKGSVVIENYRTSAISTAPDTYFFGDENSELDKKTIFSELTPQMYSSTDLTSKHNAAFASYIHCMKWSDMGQLHNDAPSCRMSTTQLLNGCDIWSYPQQSWSTPCNVHYKQTGGGTTTWDYDDTFASTGSRHLLTTPAYTDRIYHPSDGIYRIKSIYSGKSLDCSGSNDIIQYTSLGNDNQKFYLNSLGDDYYTIKCFKNNKCLDRSHSRNVIQQWSCHGGTNQKFKFSQQRGTYAILVGDGRNVKAANNGDLVGSVDYDYQYDQLFTLTMVTPSSYESIPKHVTTTGQCRSGSGPITTQPHYENGITVSGISFNACKRRLFAEHIKDSAYIWAEYTGDNIRTCYIGQNIGYTGNGKNPYSCTNIITGCKLPILGNDHKWWPGEKTGMYFAFDKSRANCILGSGWSSSVKRVYYSGTNAIRDVKIWGDSNVFTDDYSIETSHGRKNSGAANGDWVLGEWISFVDYPCNLQC